MSANQNIHFLAPGHPALSHIADFIITHVAECPDLNRVDVVLPDSRLTTTLRYALLEQTASRQLKAMLGPNFSSLEQWLRPFIPTDQKICDEQVRLLILVEALVDSPQLLRRANPWALADSLLQLFDELTLNRVSITSDLDAFNQQLIQLYQTGHKHFSGLQQEAELVHQLWFAWHEQLHAQGYLDRTTAHILAMDNSLNFDSENRHLHLIGIEPNCKTRTDWLKQILQKQNVHLWLQGQPTRPPGSIRCEDYLYALQDELETSLSPIPTEDAYQLAINSVFARSPQLTERAQEFAKQLPQSPLKNRLAIYTAHNTEQQVYAIDTQIRRWLLDGKEKIGVVTENRLLARRLRALLERADIQLEDTAGWTLATTRAAASIESLLLCVEEDFNKNDLLDLLKSGLMFPDLDQHQLMQQVYRLEHDVIQNEQVANNLMRYRQAVISRKERLEEIWSFNPDRIINLLDQIDQGTQPLKNLVSRRKRIDQFISALLESMTKLGMTTSMQKDPAGQNILQLLEEMLTASKTQTLQGSWTHFRTWLGRNFESRYFQPQSKNSLVRLLNLSQSGFENFDALIIAGMEQDAMPGSPPIVQFFNNQVRQQLGLAGLEKYQQQRLGQFTNLLYSADSILLTYRSAQDDEPIVASPWLMALEQFHDIAYTDNLGAHELELVMATQATHVIRCDTRALPAKQLHARTVLSKELVPDTYSASSYDQLMDCPYQFFAAQCLKLKPTEEIQLALSKRDYGERIHLCLQAFHSDHPFYPGPFRETITRQNRQQAIDLMQEIAAAVFKSDINENYIHKGWYHQWLNVIPTYIDWHITNKQDTKIAFTEKKLERLVATGLNLKGRLDRIDYQNNGYEIIDYKTGNPPTKKDVLAGEKIQLPFYALLTEAETLPVHSVRYLALGSEKYFDDKRALQDEELSSLANNVLERLKEMVNEMQQGHELPAWENSKVCQYCDMITLCRCGTWQE